MKGSKISKNQRSQEFNEEQNIFSNITQRITNADVKSIRRRRIASIFQHYYPEGGWGYIILVCGFVVELISYGFQQVFGILIIILSIRFRISEMEKIGKVR